jgi:hypothetical protein
MSQWDEAAGTEAVGKLSDLTGEWEQGKQSEWGFRFSWMCGWHRWGENQSGGGAVQRGACIVWRICATPREMLCRFWGSVSTAVLGLKIKSLQEAGSLRNSNGRSYFSRCLFSFPEHFCHGNLVTFAIYYLLASRVASKSALLPLYWHIFFWSVTMYVENQHDESYQLSHVQFH